LTPDGKPDFNFLKSKLQALCPQVTKSSDKHDDALIQDEEGGDKPINKQGTAAEETAKEAEKVMLQNIERLVQRIRMVSQQIIQDQQSN